jgi:hypothetical protein
LLVVIVSFKSLTWTFLTVEAPTFTNLLLLGVTLKVLPSDFRSGAWSGLLYCYELLCTFEKNMWA